MLYLKNYCYLNSWKLLGPDVSLEEDPVLTMGGYLSDFTRPVFFPGTPVCDYLQKCIWWYKYKGPYLIICSWLACIYGRYVAQSSWNLQRWKTFMISTAQRANLSTRRTREGLPYV